MQDKVYIMTPPKQKQDERVPFHLIDGLAEFIVRRYVGSEPCTIIQKLWTVERHYKELMLELDFPETPAVWAGHGLRMLAYDDLEAHWSNIMDGEEIRSTRYQISFSADRQQAVRLWFQLGNSDPEIIH